MFLMPHRAVWVAFCLWRLGKTTNSALYTRRVSFVKVPHEFAAASWRTAMPSVAQWCILALVGSRRQQSRINLSLTPSRRRFGIQCIRCIPPGAFTQDGIPAAFANLITSAAFANRIISFIAATIMVILWNATARFLTVAAGARIFGGFRFLYVFWKRVHINASHHQGEFNVDWAVKCKDPKSFAGLLSASRST